MNDQTAESQSNADTDTDARESTRKSFPRPIYLVFAVTFLVSLSVIALTGLPNRSALRQSTAAETIPPGLQSEVLGAHVSTYPLEQSIIRYEAKLVDYNVPFGIGTVSDTSSIRWP